MICGAIARCDGVSLVGSLHQELLNKAVAAARSMTHKYRGDQASDADVFRFLIECLCAQDEHGASAFGSLCGTPSFSPHEPLGSQPAAAWLVCRVAFEFDACIVDEAAAVLLSNAPECVAACGFMAAMVQTPLALALLSHVPVGGSTATVLCTSLEHEEQATKTTLISVIQAIGGELMDVVSDLVTKWFICEACECCSQACLVSMSECTRKQLLARVLEPEQPECGVMGCVWNDLSDNILNIAEMSEGVLRRRNCSSFVVLWLRCSDGQFVAFARPLMVALTGYQRWARQCARDVTESVCALLASQGLELAAQTSHSAARRAHEACTSEARWSARCVDEIARVAMQRVNAARQKDGTGFLKAQGGFENVACVCLCSMYN